MAASPETERIIRRCAGKYQTAALDLVEQVFTDHYNAGEGRMVRRLVEEIRAKQFHVPALELVMTDGLDEVIGYAMFSRFHLEGKYADKLLLLSPVAVKTSLQRQHISKALIEYGFQKAKRLGFQAVLVEGDPRNYRARGFETAANYGIYASDKIHLPRIDCLMVRPLTPDGLKHIHGVLDYGFYDALSAPPEQV